MNGDTSTNNGYATDVITDEAISWMGKVNKEKPFMLLLHHKAPHRYFFPHLKYIKQFIEKNFQNLQRYTITLKEKEVPGGCRQ